MSTPSHFQIKFCTFTPQHSSDNLGYKHTYIIYISLDFSFNKTNMGDFHFYQINILTQYLYFYSSENIWFSWKVSHAHKEMLREKLTTNPRVHFGKKHPFIEPKDAVSKWWRENMKWVCVFCQVLETSAIKSSANMNMIICYEQRRWSRGETAGRTWSGWGYD